MLPKTAVNEKKPKKAKISGLFLKKAKKSQKRPVVRLFLKKAGFSATLLHPFYIVGYYIEWFKSYCTDGMSWNLVNLKMRSATQVMV